MDLSLFKNRTTLSDALQGNTDKRMQREMLRQRQAMQQQAMQFGAEKHPLEMEALKARTEHMAAGGNKPAPLQLALAKKAALEAAGKVVSESDFAGYIDDFSKVTEYNPMTRKDPLTGLITPMEGAPQSIGTLKMHKDAGGQMGKQFIESGQLPPTQYPAGGQPQQYYKGAGEYGYRPSEAPQQPLGEADINAMERGLPQPQSTMPPAMGGYQAPSGGIPSAADLTRQATQAKIDVEGNAGSKARDVNFAKTHSEYRDLGGESTALKLIDDLTFVKSELESVVNPKDPDTGKPLGKRTDAWSSFGGKDITGASQGLTPNKILGMYNPESVDVQETLENVVQRDLRVTLGAQFTQEEGERLISRAYNPMLDEEINLRRVSALLKAMSDQANARKEAMDYFEKYNTLRGYKRRDTWTPNKMIAEMDKVSGGAKSKAAIEGEFQKRKEAKGRNKLEDVPMGAVQMLRANPDMAQDFDMKYGSGASAEFLGGN